MSNDHCNGCKSWRNLRSCGCDVFVPGSCYLRALDRTCRLLSVLWLVVRCLLRLLLHHSSTRELGWGGWALLNRNRDRGQHRRLLVVLVHALVMPLLLRMTILLLLRMTILLLLHLPILLLPGVLLLVRVRRPPLGEARMPVGWSWRSPCIPHSAAAAECKMSAPNISRKVSTASIFCARTDTKN